MRSNGANERKPGTRCASIVYLAACAVAAAALLPTVAHAAPAWLWTPAFAESQLETDYQTVDPWALHDAREQIAADLAAGWPESSSRIRHDHQDVTAALRAGYASRAACRRAGSGGGRFWCRVRVRSDLSAYESARKLTLVVRGRASFVTRPGWR